MHSSSLIFRFSKLVANSCNLDIFTLEAYDLDCQMKVSIRKGLLEELKTRIGKAINPY